MLESGLCEFDPLWVRARNEGIPAGLLFEYFLAFGSVYIIE